MLRIVADYSNFEGSSEEKLVALLKSYEIRFEIRMDDSIIFGDEKDNLLKIDIEFRDFEDILFQIVDALTDDDQFFGDLSKQLQKIFEGKIQEGILEDIEDYDSDKEDEFGFESENEDSD